MGIGNLCEKKLAVVLVYTWAGWHCWLLACQSLYMTDLYPILQKSATSFDGLQYLNIVISINLCMFLPFPLINGSGVKNQR